MASDELLAGRYRPLQVLGTGGMARVFLAEDQRLGRRVAVKRLHAHSPEDTARRFEREARLGASLNHPNLVSVYDVDTDGESVLIVMEYVEGPTLAQELESGPLAPPRVADIVGQIAGALDQVHAQGIVHRDVKPANILLRPDGMVKLADLGIALASETTQITVSGTVLGTAAYMAPEQLDGDEVGPAADIYSLAAVAFEALSGRKARQGTSPMEIVHRVVNDPPPDLREAWPEAPPAAAAALARGMAAAPADRQHRAGELAAELRAAVAEREDAGAPILTQRARRRWPALAAALVALCLIAGGAFALAGRGDDKNSSSDVATAPKREKPAPTRTETITAPSPAPTPQPQTQTAPPAQTDTSPSTDNAASDDGARLNQQGYALMNRGDYDGAIPVLQKAVGSYDSGSKDLNYGFALFNLGRSLRLAGRPDEAIPVLERRLAIPNQTATVQKELKAARTDAAKKG
jgi:eukaryotic-like serine/threonine-protein kinase